MGPHVVKKSIHLRAMPEDVWDALTNPEKTKQYFFNCQVFSDWKPGSAIVWKGTIFWFKKIELHGRIDAIESQKLLKYTLTNGATSGKPARVSTVTDELIFKNGETILTISDDVGPGEGAEKRYKRSLKGWDKVLKGLKKVVEENNDD